ncbi:MAG: MBL fold metallo-hydrolase [Myxococcales bacterium]|nr:MBL fold metallo-hydrolase [Myxococcales bacterium]
MQLDFVNHASLIVSHDGVRLLSDPWLQGTSFNDGWALLSPTAFGPDDFEGITHIWYSHEHPDHFSPRCLALCPEPLRSGIEVLFHESDDTKIVRHCEGLGFRTRELARDERVALGPDFHVRCSRWDESDDSWLLVEAGGRRLLNLNDCLVNTREQMEGLSARVGELDVLLTQFSIAGWNGNVEETERRKAGGRNMLERTVLQAQVFRPRYVIPFASFVWFCHEENHYMNSAANTVNEVEAALRERADAAPVVLYPGDRWPVGDEHHNAEALERYRADYRSLPGRERQKARTLPLEKLQELAGRFRDRVNGQVGPLRLRLRLARMNARYQQRRRPGLAGRLVGALQLALLRPKPARIWLQDLECAASFDLRHGLVPSDRTREACDVALSSDSLAYAFRFLWGGLALQINGRFHELHREGRRPLFDALWMADAMNRREGAEARPL